MSRGKELARNTMVLMVGKICTQCVTFFLLPVYTALLSQEEYGTVDLLNTYVSLFVPIILMQVDQGVFRFLIDAKGHKEKSQMISTTLFFSILSNALYIILFICIAPVFNNEYKYFLLTNVVATSFLTLFLQILRGLDRNDFYAISSFLSASINLLLNILFVVVFKMGANGMLLANLLANLICILIILVKIRKYINIKFFSKYKLKGILHYSYPLVPSAISWWIFGASDRTIISAVYGVALNGVYSVANKFPSIYVILYNMFDLSWNSTAALHIDDKDKDEFFNETVNLMFNFFNALCLGIIAALPFAFKYLVDSKFEDAYYQVPILMIAILLDIVIGLYSVVYVARKQTKKLAKTAIVSAIINLVLNLIFIRLIGLYAASFSTLISYAVMLIYRCYDIKKDVNIKINRKILIVTVFMMAIVLFAYYSKIKIYCVIAFLLTVVFALVTNLKFIRYAINMLKEVVQNHKKK